MWAPRQSSTLPVSACARVQKPSDDRECNSGFLWVRLSSVTTAHKEMIVGQHERPPAAVAPSVGPVPVTKVPDSDAGPLEPTAENEMALPVPRCYGAVDSPHRGAGSGGVLAGGRRCRVACS